ncbi:hypothetical protein NKR23_g8048 [Pleurostoma richardsiae]|uniref:Uncharacterized protein n=1 Tax=Pleurostoma richardsiae TaxID=41990 RepID=A0AA38R6Y3_9PEZI|nr:hypothetical protein NKR23_g8048 [Pleurostoma richardsiae]
MPQTLLVTEEGGGGADGTDKAVDGVVDDDDARSDGSDEGMDDDTASPEGINEAVHDNENVDTKGANSDGSAGEREGDDADEYSGPSTRNPITYFGFHGTLILLRDPGREIDMINPELTT